MRPTNNKYQSQTTHRISTVGTAFMAAPNGLTADAYEACPTIVLDQTQEPGAISARGEIGAMEFQFPE
jgi:hypothetical protein